MAQKNKPVSGHAIDLLLSCGHIIVEPIEAAIYMPRKGEQRYCPRCNEIKQVTQVGQMYWLDDVKQ